MSLTNDRCNPRATVGKTWGQMGCAALFILVTSAIAEADAQRLWALESESSPEPAASFVLGDINADGTRDLRDGVVVLEHLFYDLPAKLACEDAADLNYDGRIDLSDAVLLLRWVLLTRHVGVESLECQEDLSPDDLDCLDRGWCP